MARTTRAGETAESGKAEVGSGKEAVAKPEVRDLNEVIVEVLPGEAKTIITDAAASGTIVSTSPATSQQITPDAGQKKESPAPTAKLDDKPRGDSFRCPFCGNFGCPQQKAKWRERTGWARQRKCSKCEKPFRTLELWARGSVTVGCGEESVKA